MKKIEKAIRRQRILNERKRKNKALVDVAERMRKKGASEGSIKLGLRGAYEIMKPARRTNKLEYSDLVLTPDPNVEVPGILLSEVETQPVAWLWERRISYSPKVFLLSADYS